MTTLFWAAWVAVVGLLACGAAYVIEPALRALRWPTRPAWLLALLAQLAAIAWSFVDAGAARPHGAFVGAWMVAVGIAALVYLRAARTLRRERGGWRVTVAEEMPVWVSERTGPAVVGFLRSIVVAPRWALAMGDRERRLLLRHEAEHVAAWDPTLLLTGLVAAALVPWSPASWWALARLRLAIEVDCDRRVLRAEPDVAAYGELLVAVQERVVPGAAGIAAFAERKLPIEERIEAMTARRPRGAAWTWSARAMAAGVLVLGACMAPCPPGAVAPGGRVRAAADVDSLAMNSGVLMLMADAFISRRNPGGIDTIAFPGGLLTRGPGGMRIDAGADAAGVWQAWKAEQPDRRAGRAEREARRDSVHRAIRAHLTSPGRAPVGDSMLVSLVLDPSYRVVAETAARRTIRPSGIYSVDAELRRRFPSLPAAVSRYSGVILDGSRVGVGSTSLVEFWQLDSAGTSIR